MRKIYFISTIHKEIGKCDAGELHKILKKLSPEVVFLEALDSTYPEYKRMIFSEFGLYDTKLEIKAIQYYLLDRPLTYVPVLDFGLSDAFMKRCDLLEQFPEHKSLYSDFYFKEKTLGFSFLNSKEAIALQEELRALEDKLLYNSDLNQKALEDIDSYENNMMKNISAYCRENTFEKAVFMCGVAHRKSMIEKISSSQEMLDLEIDWHFPEGL